MIGLLGIFTLFLAMGLVIMRRQRLLSKEIWAFVTITCIGLVLWGSIILQKPLDLNKAIAGIIESMF
ncbi:hypothetical protein KP806_01765 [Paenibacillus sp. N4]|uniref:hypothetical protein n=1 Tax=Paenibacillus vietnamensis TaxID=2590547 RepID=UPI001CD0A9CA|nr:hypothetical protein [Paenibacillus vietnamensis]MCA0753759.1 hypothetical protein [Paenibacillus vietnamensis]